MPKKLGNVFPVNGCSVEKGMITEIGIAKNSLARFQHIEYIRSFMAGRLGWSFLNCLLIISGAFGVFRKERIVTTGGYLTSHGRYGKDTVGEDMELVVRIKKHMHSLGLKFRICYAFNANCWTEFFRFDRDYYGFFPQSESSYQVREIEGLEKRPDLIYLADTYGVYEDDYLKQNPRGTRSELMYGGIGTGELDALTRRNYFLRLKKAVFGF